MQSIYTDMQDISHRQEHHFPADTPIFPTDINGISYRYAQYCRQACLLFPSDM